MFDVRKFILKYLIKITVSNLSPPAHFTPLSYGELAMLDVTKFAVLSVFLVFVSHVASINFPLRSGQQGNRMVTVDSDGKRFFCFLK